jgi:Protein of unknown function (DUF2891)
MLAQELSAWDDPDARRWAANIRPLADTIAELFLAWLARATYPSREGAHANSAFGLVRALPLARARMHDGDPSLLAAISQAALRWYGDDTNYPAGWEPNGGDFLSPALTEAELMTKVLEPAAFADWLERFLPGLAHGHPASLFQPAIVSDPTDGQIAHLHGLNLYRAYAYQQLTRTLPDADPRGPVLRDAARRHAEAALPAVCGGDDMVEPWLAGYAVCCSRERHAGRPGLLTAQALASTTSRSAKNRARADASIARSASTWPGRSTPLRGPIGRASQASKTSSVRL